MPRDLERFWRTTQNLRRFEYGPRVTTLTQVADQGYAPLASPTFTGDPRAPTPATADNDTSLATTAYVRAQGSGVGTLTGVTAGTGITVSGTAPSPTVALTTPVTIANGGTGATTAAAALTGLGAITTITAGTGLAGGGTSGNVTLGLVTPVPIALGGTASTNAAAALTALGAVAKSGDTMSGVLIVDANATVGPVFTTGANSTTDAAIELGGARTASGNAHLDLHSEVGNDFELRILRAAGLNGDATVQNAGTGALNLVAGVYGASMSGTNGNIVFPGQIAGTGTQARKGTPGPTSPYQVNIDWAPGGHLWIDNVDTGLITVTCDYRIKENIADLPSMWDTVKELRPISYTIKENEELLSRKSPDEQWGFIAHELQKTLLKSAATGHKDAPNLIQSPNVMALIAPLTRALQEAMVRIEALEAAR